MATRHYEEDSPMYNYPNPFSHTSAKNQALNHAIEVLKTYGMAKDAMVYGWGTETGKIEVFRGKRGEPNVVGTITKCSLNEGISFVQARLTRTYEVR